MDLIVTVPADRVSFVKKLLRELDLPVKPATTQPTKLDAGQQRLAGELKNSLAQVEAHQKGELQLPSAYELLDEL